MGENSYKHKSSNIMEGALGITVARHGCGIVELLKYEERDVISLLNSDPAPLYNPDEIEDELFRLVDIPKQYLISPSDLETPLDEKRRREEIKIEKIRVDHCSDKNRDECQKRLIEKEKGNILKIELANDEELTGFINRERLYAFIEKYGLPLEDGYSYKTTDLTLPEGKTDRILIPAKNYSQRVFHSVIGYDYLRICNKVILYYAFAEVLGAIARYGINDEKTMCAFAFFDGIRVRIGADHPISTGSTSSRIADAYAKNTKDITSRTSRLSIYVKFAFKNDLRALEYSFSSISNKAGVYARDYFSYLAYQLLVKWNAVLDGKKTRGIYIKCAGSGCNNLFWADRRNKKYCKYCDRRREYALTDAAKEKRREKSRMARINKEKEGGVDGEY